MNLLDQPIGVIARDLPGASRIFHHYQLDFCCNGQRLLGEVLAEQGIVPALVVAGLETLLAQHDQAKSWTNEPISTLIGHILDRYHAVHREQLTELLRLARRVELVHGDKAECPHGLADHLDAMRQELESHMQKEEQILFPMLRRHLADQARGPITIMRLEHDEHDEALARMVRLARDLELPPGACNTWRALYAGLTEFKDDLLQHIHLENNLLFDQDYLSNSNKHQEVQHG
ncbi:iron-sulfur cluster repair protein YtfE [Zobellella maritima]|uniref:iron-sulfur cluster repair protein YtfE n=1 Tax=Zobellella maritima TaxID=2059725 RepID=UPI000E30393E|nr:iron-sulfur cluster repair protein YtfE [Zobellella maritima]